MDNTEKAFEKQDYEISKLQAEVAQKSGYIRELSDALEETRKERDTALLQIDEIKKAFRLSHSCVDGKCWMCMGKSVVDHVLSITEKPKQECTCASTGSHAVFCALAVKR